VTAPRLTLDEGLTSESGGDAARPRQSGKTTGASWEGFALEQVVGLMRAEREAHFWRTHAGAELDVLITRGGAPYGFEFTFADAPRTTKSMRVALEDLGLKRLFVVYPGTRRFELDEDIVALPLAHLRAEADRL
jgi:hypothetical protein